MAKLPPMERRENKREKIRKDKISNEMCIYMCVCLYMYIQVCTYAM